MAAFRTYRKRPGAFRPCNNPTTSAQGPSAAGPGSVWLFIDGEDTRADVSLTPAEARSIAADLLDLADFAEDAPCECGVGRIEHRGGYVDGAWCGLASAKSGCREYRKAHPPCEVCGSPWHNEERHTPPHA